MKLWQTPLIALLVFFHEYFSMDPFTKVVTLGFVNIWLLVINTFSIFSSEEKEKKLQFAKMIRKFWHVCDAYFVSVLCSSVNCWNGTVDSNYGQENEKRLMCI
jgi:hypothetical protein